MAESRRTHDNAHLLKRVIEPKSAFESGKLSLVVHSSQRNSRLEAAVKQRQLNGFAHSDQSEPRGTQPQSECASLAADHLPLAAQLLSLDIRVENGGLHRRS